MNTSSLAASLFEQLQQEGLGPVSQKLGIDESQARQAIGTAVPLLLAAMGSNASSPQGAQSLLNALQRDHAPAADRPPPGLGQLLDTVLGGGAGKAGDGTGILGHVFGNQTPQAAQVLGRQAGLDSGKASQLLAVLAPIVMAFLARRFAQQGNANELRDTLGQESRQLGLGGGGMGDLLGGLLDQDGNGRLDAGDLLKLGAGLLGKR
ncbi:DUF937 domain-containing protein [Stenotrophomonas sp. Marseille-Q4652]|uniref:DUF937 domain-containing protein n=1 Tax=Stenotrophomonas sp. Marseille-Q4652 TaxID=2866595 RepID=UPI001CE48B23|nr:DUF937 domain-containing protein [Stenotrophomonas sp. Marseille-Q4652]